MNEEEVKRQVLKIHSFDEFSFKRMREVLEAIEELGFDIKFIDNGNIVCTDNSQILNKESQDE